MLQTRQDVAALLEVTDQGLCHLLFATSSQKLYRSFEIPKKSGGWRQIIAPQIRLKTLQKRLLKILECVYVPKTSAHGFVISRSICTNAKLHLRRKLVLNLDLKDFFASINFGRVRGMFLKKPYYCAPQVATVLAQICCYQNELPQGAPTSPIISNMLSARLDSNLAKIAREYKCRYSRYADDITFSINYHKFPKEIAFFKNIEGKKQIKIGATLTKTIQNNGFRINEEKTRIRNKTQRQEVTGLVTNEKLNVTRQFVREVRAMLYNWKSEGLEICQQKYELKINQDFRNAAKAASFKNLVKGRVDFIGAVRGKEDHIYLKYLQQLSVLAPELVSDATHRKLQQILDQYSHLLDSLWVIEATHEKVEVPHQGTAFYLDGYGFVTCSHILMDQEDSLVEVYRRDQSERSFAKIELLDPKLDLAILSTKDKPAATFEPSSKTLKAGDQILLAGFPKFSNGHTGIAEPGYIIGKHRDIYQNPRILISAEINSGNSGGPVFDAEGKVIGIAAKGIDDAGKKGFYEVIPVASLEIMKQSKLEG